MNADEIAAEAISKINKQITNLVFLEIQNDRQLMQHYLRCIEASGLNSTNQRIGKAVKASYQLVNLLDRDDDPSCTLIQSHQKFV
jgi:hypothetical protein